MTAFRERRYNHRIGFSNPRTWTIIRVRCPTFPPEQVTPFVFADPSGKRWPPLRLILRIGSVLFFVALVLFVQALFVIARRRLAHPTSMVDLFLLASLPFGAWSAVLPFIIIFLAMDVLFATLACMLEREPIVRAWRILPMCLIYRPMLSYCIWKAILRAIKGAWVSWGKLERTASVPVRA